MSKSDKAKGSAFTSAPVALPVIFYAAAIALAGGVVILAGFLFGW